MFAALCLTLAAAGCRDAVPPMPEFEESHPAEPAAVTNAAPVEAPVSKAETAVVRAFQAYERTLRKGDISGARRQVLSVEDALPSAGRQTFWDSVIPLEDALTLRLLRPCPECASGACSVCGTTGKCTLCSGSGACPSCEGKGRFLKPCTACICPTCRGEGRCPTCHGLQKAECAACSGTGRGAGREQRAPCRACGGKGYRRGLAKHDGSAESLPCLTCKGKGYIVYTVRPPCAVCGGSGKVPCAPCAGTGTCPACNGTGRKATCSVCNGTGIAATPCETCGASGKCPQCGGEGACPACDGSGLCRTCGGSSLMLAGTLPVASGWLVQTAGYAVCSASAVLFSGVPAGERVSTNLAHRAVWFTCPSGTVTWISVDGSWNGAAALLVPEPTEPVPSIEPPAAP